jgi:sterol 3beta-glucosyltransferase
MRVAMITFGSQGDVRPLVALGQALVRAGHHAVLLADSEFAALSAAAGVAFVPLAGGSLRDPAMRSTWDALFERGLDPKVLMRVVFEHVGRNTEAWGRQFREAALDADLVVAAGPTFYIGLAVAEALGLPTVGVALQPMTPTREFGPTIIPSTRLPRASYRALHWLLMDAAWFLTARPVQRLRRSVLGLPAWPWYGPVRRLLRQRMPTLTAVSPVLVPRPRDWPDSVHMTGFWFLDAADTYQPAPALARFFLEAGPPPVYVGFGSMAGFDPGATARLVTEALAGRRAVLAAGWGGLAAGALPDTVCPIEAASHDWLLPRVGLAVHHGGAGTTAAAARAGVPQVVIPHLGDQPFWAARVHALGAAPAPLERRTLTAERLAAAIRDAERPLVRRAAAALGARIRAEDGVGEAVRIIERAAIIPAGRAVDRAGLTRFEPTEFGEDRTQPAPRSRRRCRPHMFW